MATPPKFTAFRIEDYKGAPQWFEPFMRAVNDVLVSIVDALNAHLTRTENMASGEKIDATIVGGTALQISHTLATKPKHVYVTKLAKTDGDIALAAAWSFTWKMNQANQIELNFQGLVASTKYVCNVVYE